MKYQIVRQVTSAEGTQRFEVEADSSKKAIKMFREGKSEIVENDVEVTDFKDLDEFDFENDMYEV